MQVKTYQQKVHGSWKNIKEPKIVKRNEWNLNLKQKKQDEHRKLYPAHH